MPPNMRSIDTLANVFYVLGLQALARLCANAGALVAELEARAARTEAALVAKCYDDEAGAFFDLAGADERPLRTLTILHIVRIPVQIGIVESGIAEVTSSISEKLDIVGSVAGAPLPGSAVSRLGTKAGSPCHPAHRRLHHHVHKGHN